MAGTRVFNPGGRGSLLPLVSTSRCLLGSHPNQGGDPRARGAPRRRGRAGARAGEDVLTPPARPGGTGDSEVEPGHAWSLYPRQGHRLAPGGMEKRAS